MSIKIKNFTPAITNMSPEILHIASKQPGYFRTHEFAEIVKESEERILDLIDCRKGRVAFITSSGTGAMDAAISNIVGNKEKVLIINGGSFGQRWVDICDFYSINYTEFKTQELNINDLKDLKDLVAHNQPDYILMQATETSTLQRFNVEKVGHLCKENNIKLIVDAITSFAIDDFNMDEFNVDVAILSSQKGLALTPGLSMIVIKNTDIINNASRSYYFDLKNYIFDDLTDVGLPFTPNLIAIEQLHYQLGIMKQKGIENVIKSVNDKALKFRRIIKERNLPLKIETAELSNCGTLFHTEKTDVKQFFEKMKNVGIFFTPTGGENGKKFSVGHLGEQSEEDMMLFIDKIEEWMNEK